MKRVVLVILLSLNSKNIVAGSLQQRNQERMCQIERYADQSAQKLYIMYIIALRLQHMAQKRMEMGRV